MSTGEFSTTSTRRPLPAASAAPAVRWDSWLLRDETGWTLRILAAMVLGGVLTWLVTEKIYLAVLAVAALFLSAWHLWLPREFVIDALGLKTIVFGRRRRIGWEAIRRVEMMDDGILFWIDRRAATADHKQPRSLFVPHQGDRTEISNAIAEFIARTSNGNLSHAKKQAT